MASMLVTSICTLGLAANCDARSKPLSGPGENWGQLELKFDVEEVPFVAVIVLLACWAEDSGTSMLARAVAVDAMLTCIAGLVFCSGLSDGSMWPFRTRDCWAPTSSPGVRR